MFTLKSPAKLNLALQVTGRDHDGFHTLNTLFERIDLADNLLFSPAEDGDIHISCTHPGVPCDERNLVHKAALILREAGGLRQGACVHIEKNIPVAAGLAGGSSNAATALLGLNRLWKCGFSRRQLIRLARRIGSDVAFFLYDAPLALGTGRGDRIRVLPVEHRFWHVLITAKQPLLTKDVYALYARQFWAARASGLTKKSADVTMLVRALKARNITRARELIFNDLEGPIGVLRPALLTLKHRVQKAAQGGVCFSGSGPSIFAVTPDEKEARRIAAIFRRTYDQVFVVRTS
jgi:4-diphosphocytidyl-2-C-methyl-D-erythritol kinase